MLRTCIADLYEYFSIESVWLAQNRDMLIVKDRKEVSCGFRGYR